MSLESEVYERVKRIICSLLKISHGSGMNDVSPQINMETDLVNDLGVDSLEMLDLISAVEKEFNMSLNFRELTSKHKVNDIVEYVIALQKGSNPDQINQH